MDSESGSLVRVRTHYRLLVGLESRRYSLPLEDALLDSAVADGDLCAPSPEIALILFAIEAVLRGRLLPGLGLSAESGAASASAGSTDSHARTLERLSSRADPEMIRAVLERQLPKVPPRLFQECVESLRASARRQDRLAASRQLARALQPDGPSGPIAAWILARVQPLRSLIGAEAPGRCRLRAGGRVVVFSGGEESHNRASMAALESSLASVLDVRVCRISGSANAARSSLGGVQALVSAGTIVLCDRFPDSRSDPSGDSKGSPGSNGAPVFIDTSQLSTLNNAEIRNAVWRSLPRWAPVVEVVGFPGSGKSALSEELVRRGVVADGRVYGRPSASCLMSGILALWGVERSGLTLRLLREMVLFQATMCSLKKQIAALEGPVLIDQGPVFQYANLANSARRESGEIGLRTIQAWLRRSLETGTEFLDQVFWIEVNDSTLIERINSRSKAHPIKGLPESSALTWLSEFRNSLDSVLKMPSGANRFSLEQLSNESSLSHLADAIEARLARDEN